MPRRQVMPSRPIVNRRRAGRRRGRRGRRGRRVPPNGRRDDSSRIRREPHGAQRAGCVGERAARCHHVVDQDQWPARWPRARWRRDERAPDVERTLRRGEAGGVARGAAEPKYRQHRRRDAALAQHVGRSLGKTPDVVATADTGGGRPRRHGDQQHAGRRWPVQRRGDRQAEVTAEQPAQLAPTAFLVGQDRCSGRAFIPVGGVHRW